MPGASEKHTQIRRTKLVFAPHELAAMQPVIDAVCGELGVTAREKARRRAVMERVMAAYRRGRQQPLNMVAAGLSEQA
ncbi:MAG: hypothetical protein IH590_13025 [Aquamicrobium sp.]|nr:hypothetical protein [Aquamicrobium sp.]